MSPPPAVPAVRAHAGLRLARAGAVLLGAFGASLFAAGGSAQLGGASAASSALPSGPLSAPTPAAPVAGEAELRALKAAALQPEIIDWPVIWDHERERLALLYFERHKGWAPGQDPKVALKMQPRAIVEHWTAGPTARSAYNTFRAPRQVRRRDRSDANAVNLCSHFVVDRDGTIYRLMPETRMGRHAIGLNHLAIGVENVGDGQRWPMTKAQIAANARLVRWLSAAFPITHLVAHAEVRWMEDHPYFIETDPKFRSKRGDPGEPFMQALRAEVADLGLEAPVRPPKTAKPRRRRHPR